MRKLQDDYYYNVSLRHRLLRLGPRRARLTRQEYNERKRQAQHLTDMHQALRQHARDLKKSADERVNAAISGATTNAEGLIIQLKDAAKQKICSIKEQARAETSALRNDVRSREQIIANQEATILMLQQMLEEHGIETVRPSTV
jgi:hypothetical protein